MDAGWGRRRARAESNPVRVTAGAAVAVSRRPAHRFLRTNRKLSSGRSHGGGSLRAAGCHLVAAVAVRGGGGCTTPSCRGESRFGRLAGLGGFLRVSRRRQPLRSEAAGSGRLCRAGGSLGEAGGQASGVRVQPEFREGSKLPLACGGFKGLVVMSCSVWKLLPQ